MRLSFQCDADRWYLVRELAHFQVHRDWRIVVISPHRLTRAILSDNPIGRRCGISAVYVSTHNCRRRRLG